MSCDGLRRLLEEFEDFYDKVDPDPEVDSPVALGKLDFFYEPLVSCPGCVSIEASGRISLIFFVKANSNRQVDSPMESPKQQQQ